MKNFIFIMIILALVVSTVSAQDIYDSRLLARIGMSAEEIREIQEIQFRMEQQIRLYNADLNILKAQLEKLLLNENPDMDDVRTTIRKTIQLRSQSEITRVEARVLTRQKMGTQNWENMLKLLTKLRQVQRTQDNAPIQNGVEPNARTGQNSGIPNPRN